MARALCTLAQAWCAAAVLAVPVVWGAPPARGPGSPIIMTVPVQPAPLALPAVIHVPVPPRVPAPVATAGPEIPLEVFAAGPQMSEPHLSPDGRKLVFLTSVAGQLHIAVRELHSGRERIILNAAAGDFSLTHCEFKTNDRLLCHLEGVARGGNPERLYPASRLLAVDADGGALRILFRNAFFARLPPAARSQFQDRIIHWLPDDAYHVLIELGDEGSVFPSVYKLDVYRGDLKLVVPSQPPVMDWTADSAGVVRFGYGFRQDTGVYVARGSAEAQWRTLEEFKRFDRTRFDPLAFGARPDDLLVFAPYQGRAAVWQIDLDAPASGLKLLFSRADVDVAGILEWPLDRHVTGFVYETDRPHTHFIDTRAAAIEETLERALPGAYHVVVDSSRDESKLVTVSFSDVMPPRYHLLDTATGRLTELGRQVANLDEARLAHMKPVTVPGAGGIAIPGYLTLPPGSEPGQRLPAVVLPHGGPYARDHWGYDPLLQVIASRGYAVLQLNFRGSTGYGEQWRDAGHQAWGTIMHEDITAGAHWLIEQGIADPARLGIVGWSYGGYAALTGVEKEPELYRCAVSIAGVSDMSQMALDDERFYGGKDSAGDAMGTDPATLRAESPLQHVDRIRVPVLLVHGEDDYTVLAEQSKAMDRALAKQGLPHELVLIKHGEHSLVRPEMRLILYQKVSEFLRANLGPGQVPGASPVLVSGAAATR
ncbi:MAG TPA: S9 family peptidase [Steroidobacteraceae bacterium]|nr:S9 family peptidase [Steroidobacteraceae bacterium]